jgi:hypothetical protein
MSVLAMEEIGKAWASLALLEDWWDDDEMRGLYWRLVKGGRHAAKVDAGLLLEKLLAVEGLASDEIVEALSRTLGGDLHQLKLRALYVDLMGDQEIEGPELVKKPGIEMLVRSTEEERGHLGDHHRGQARDGA